MLVYEPAVTVTASAADLVAARLGPTDANRSAVPRRIRFDGEREAVEELRTVFQLSVECIARAQGRSTVVASTIPCVESMSSRFGSPLYMEVTAMSRAIVVRYEAREDAVEHHQLLIKQVFEELNSRDPGGVRYTVLRVTDGLGFVHIAVFDGEADPLTESSAFQAFQHGIDERLKGAPTVTAAAVIGSYDPE
jgi:hypothetical protein